MLTRKFANASIDTFIAAPAAAIVAIVLSIVSKMELEIAILCGALLGLSIYGVLLRIKMDAIHKKHDRQQPFLDKLESIPESEDNLEWEKWLTGTEAWLRGMGMLRKSRALRKIMSQTTPKNRPSVAKEFFRGLAGEAFR